MGHITAAPGSAQSASSALLAAANVFTGAAQRIKAQQPSWTFIADNGGSQIAIDSSATIPFRDVVFGARIEDITGGTVSDASGIYLSHGASTSTISNGGNPLAAGATSIPLAGALTMGTTGTVLIGTNTLHNQEVVTVTAGSGTATLTCSATQFAHADGVLVTVLGDSAHPSTVGIGQAQPSSAYKLQVVGGAVSGTAMGTMLVKAGLAPTIVAAAGGVNGSGFVWAGRDFGGQDHIWIDNSAAAWCYRQRADSTASNPVFVVQDSATDTEQFRITSQGKIQFLADANAVISRGAAGLIQIANQLDIGGSVGIGPGYNAAATPARTLDVKQTSTNNATFGVGTAQTTFTMTVSGTAATITIGNSNNGAINFQQNGTTLIGFAAGAKLGFFAATPISQPSAVGAATGYAAGATAVTFHSDDTYTGNVGSTAYTLNGIVAALKNLGLIAA